MKNLLKNKFVRLQKAIINKKFVQQEKLKDVFEWGYRKLPDKFTKYTKKCLRKCVDCEKRLSCLDKKAIFQPIPKYLFYLGGSFMMMPIFLILYPEKFVQLYSQTFNCAEPPEDRKKIYYELVDKMHLKYPNRIHFLESPSISFPSAFGSDTILGSIVIIPQSVAQFYDQEMRIEFEDLYVPLKDLAHEKREEILKKTGVLIPFKNELDFVIGHEIGHIKRSHSIHILSGALSSIFITHFGLKYFNHICTNFNRKPINSPWNYLLSLTLGFSVGLFLHQWKREIEADLESVNSLGLVDDALILSDMKAEQNKFIKKYYGDKNILENGDNIFHLEHPPPSIQKKYLLYNKEHHKQN